MKQDNFFRALKCTTMSMKIFPLIPFFLLYYVLLDRNYGWPQMLWSTALLLLIGFLGYGLTLPVLKQELAEEEAAERERTEGGERIPWKESRELKRKKIFLYGAGLAFAVVAAGLLYLTEGKLVLRIGISALLFFLCWIRFVRATADSYSSSYSFREYIQCAMCYLGIWAVLLLLRTRLVFAYQMAPLAFTFLLVTVGAGLVLNQANIDDMMERRHHQKSALPQKIRVYNLTLMVAILTLLAVGFLFRQEVFSFLKLTGRTLLTGLVYLIFGFFWLFSKLMPGAEEAEGTEGSGGQNMMGGLPKGEGSPIWDILFLVALAAIVIFFATKGRKIWMAILEKLRQGIQKLSHYLLGTLHPRRDGLRGEESAYYSDQVESLEEIQEQEGNFPAQTRRELKKEYLAWCRLSDPTEQVRRGFAFFIHLAVQKKLPLTQADTVGEMEKKAEQRGEAELREYLWKGAPIYDEVRYGERAPSQGQTEVFLQMVQRAYTEEMAKTKTRRRFR